MDRDLTALADAYGVAVQYEDADRRLVHVADDVVIAVLAQFGVDASTPDAVARALAAVRDRPQALPPTVVLRVGTGYPLPGPATLRLEDGAERAVDGAIPADLPLGWHRLVTAEQDVTLCVVPERLPVVPPSWGWMVQLYSLRSTDSWGIGDFADLAEFTRRSADELGAGVLLVNPVQATGLTHPVQRSPYSPVSRSYLNPLYLSVTTTETFRQAEPELQDSVRALRPDDTADLIDYDTVLDRKLAALELLWPHRVEPDEPAGDFATYCALADTHGPDWRTWPESVTAQPDRVAFHAWLQQLCRLQLDAVRRSGMAVGIVHDLPVGVHPGGADTWAWRDVFAADVRVGAPPDAFSQQGQDWNLPPWRPDKLAASGYAPFRDVLRGVLAHGDGIRVDHVAGLWRLWWIPPGNPASRGTYVHYDAEAMLGVLALEAHRANAIVVGEDLGTVQPVVTRTLHERGMLSSAVLWFQRDYDQPEHPFVEPSRWAADAMASISTHDLPTVAGWLSAEHVRLRAELGLLTRPTDTEYAEAKADREAMLELLRRAGIPADDLVVALHALLASAASRLVLTSPLDVLGELRQPNLPGTIDEYPNWRIRMRGSIETFFADPRVQAVVAPLRAARPPVG